MTTIDDYILYKTLGTGAFSKVKLAKYKDGKKYALKAMKADSSRTKPVDKEVFKNEIRALRYLAHPNIIKLHKFSERAIAKRSDGNKLKIKYIALEFCEGGELFDYIAGTGRFSEPEARYFYHQLIDALEYMHNKGYSHRDVKPENILLDREFNLKLADFGFATKEDLSTKRKGTVGYMAPEVINDEAYKGEDADLFSSAIILFILITQCPPFIKADYGDRFYKKVYKNQWDDFWDVHSDLDLSESFKDFFSKMVSVDPSDRLTIDELKEHEWYTGPVPSKYEIIKKFSKRQAFLVKKETKKLVKKLEVKEKKSKRVTSMARLSAAERLAKIVENAKKKDDYYYGSTFLNSNRICDFRASSKTPVSCLTTSRKSRFAFKSFRASRRT